MKGNALAVVAMVAVGALVWVIMAWPSPGDDSAIEPLQPLPAELRVAPAAPAAEPEQAEPQPQAAPQPAAAPQPQAAPAVPAAAEPAAAPPDVAGSLFSEDQGPVAEYKELYASEPRDSGAPLVESTIRNAFVPADGAPELFKSVLCRQTICKVELRWSGERTGAYVAGMTRALVGMDPKIAVSPAGPIGADSVRPLEVYIKRPQPAAAN